MHIVEELFDVMIFIFVICALGGLHVIKVLQLTVGSRDLSQAEKKLL